MTYVACRLVLFWGLFPLLVQKEEVRRVQSGRVCDLVRWSSLSPFFFIFVGLVLVLPAS
jgi:hypothetical protein